MRCTDPRTVGFAADGKTISWSFRTSSKEYATFKLPCGQCLECRLDYARQWAVRCVHESQMYERNCFITLTYSDEKLTSPKLVYGDFQKFMKKLRKLQEAPIGVFVTGEYGEKTKRPHWHAIIFNWSPSDGKPKYKTAGEHQVYESDTLTRTWGHGLSEYGSVTIDSAGYCARYAAKKLVHGADQQHDFTPISKKSSKHAIGKRWLEKFWPDVFLYGKCLHDGANVGIPRYYERWFKQNHPDHWLTYVTNVKLKKIESAQARSDKEQADWLLNNNRRRDRYGIFCEHTRTIDQRRALITQSNFKMLQDYLKL